MTLSIASNLNAQEVVKLYNGVIKGSKTPPSNYIEVAEVGGDKLTRIRKVTEPSLTVFTPSKEKATGTGVIICPGGGYGILAIGHEGYDVAKRLNEIGIAAFVLKYRLPSDAIMEDKQFGPLMDVQQAIYLLRKNAAQWNIKTDRIGVMGFSAGGHLASNLTVHYNDVKIENKEQLSLRPDFSILLYPVISFTEAYHAGSVENLTGKNTTQAQRDYFSSEKHINTQTPPTFLVHANDDKVVPVKNSLSFNQAMADHAALAEMHIYQSGGHGFGLNNKTTSDQWFDRLHSWLKANKLL